MSRSLFSYLVSGFLHLAVYGVLTWAWLVLPDRMAREGEVITLITLAPAAAEPQPAEVERPIETPSTVERQPQQIQPPKSDLPRSNPQLQRDPPRDPATPATEVAPPPVLLAERQEPDRDQPADPPPPPVQVMKKQASEAVMIIMQQAESGAQADEVPRKLPTNPKPEYPAAARAAGQSGRVVLLVSIRADGRVSGVRVLTSSGVASLDQSALTTVRDRWRFEPARRAGVAVSFEATIGVNFGFELP